MFAPVRLLVDEPSPEKLASEAGDSTGGGSGPRAELFQSARKLLEPSVDALHGAVREMLDAFGEYALCFAREALDGEIELPTEPLRGFLARRSEGTFELLRGRFGM